MEAVLFQSKTRQELKEFVGLAKKIGISVRYVKDCDTIPKAAAKHKSKSRNKDLDIINLNADYLNSEASDVLNYQALK